MSRVNHGADTDLHEATTAAALGMDGDEGAGDLRAELVAFEWHGLEVEGEWEQLADATRASPFRRPGWIGAWWNAFGRGKLELATVRREGRLTAVLPLGRRLGALTSPTNWHTPEFGPVASDRASLRRLVQALFAHPPRRVSLAFLDSESETASFLREAASEPGLRVLERTLMRSPYLEIDQTWPEYERSLSRNVRGDAKRRLRRLQELGVITTDVDDGSERLEELLTEGFRIEASGWKGSARSAIASQPQTETFYRSVARWAAARGWLRLAFLRLDGVPIAFHYCLEHEGTHYFIKGGHDSDYSKFSPGKVLTHSMLSRAFSIGLSNYEFLGGEDAWKLRWTSSVRQRALFHAFRPSPDGLLEWSVFNYGRRAARRVAHTGPVGYLMSRVR
jgi:CelD/BcsL family acetyltransferase involved in cellulose biosynthesis